MDITWYGVAVTGASGKVGAVTGASGKVGAVIGTFLL